MANPSQTLREIHRLRRYAKSLQDKLDELPKRLDILTQRLAYQEEERRKAKEHIDKLKVKAKEDELSLQSTLDKIERFTKQLNDIISKREYDALQHEIEHAKREKDVLEDRILQTYSEIDEWTAKMPGFDQAVADAKKELEEFQARLEPRRAEFSEELEKTQKELAEVERQLPAADPHFAEQYHRLIRQRGEDAFSPVRSQSCHACYNEITTQQLHELRIGRIVLCKSCGRFLYLEE